MRPERGYFFPVREDTTLDKSLFAQKLYKLVLPRLFAVYLATIAKGVTAEAIHRLAVLGTDEILAVNQEIINDEA